MSEFDPKKLHIDFIDRTNIKKLVFPRKYTLTHSDRTGELYLSIGIDYNYKKFSGIYSRLMRDEVLGEWKNADQIRLDIHCLVSGGMAIGPAKWRGSIFRQHMKMVLKAICYGDRSFIKENQDFLSAPIYVHFHTRKKKADRIERWGAVSDFMPDNYSYGG